MINTYRPKEIYKFKDINLFVKLSDITQVYYSEKEVGVLYVNGEIYTNIPPREVKNFLSAWYDYNAQNENGELDELR